MFPNDLFFDNDKEERISINILCHCEFGFEKIVEDYTTDKSIEIAKKKNQIVSNQTKPDGSPTQSKKKRLKEQAGKVGWMLGKMAGLIEIFKDKKEDSSSSSDEEENEMSHYKMYEDSADQDSPLGLKQNKSTTSSVQAE